MELVLRSVRYTSCEFSNLWGVPCLIQSSVKDMSSVVAKSVPHCDHASARCALYVHEFLTNNRRLSFHTFSAHQILCGVSSFLFQNSVWSLKGRRLNDITMTKVKSRAHLTSCKQCTLQNPLNGGTFADPH